MRCVHVNMVTIGGRTPHLSLAPDVAANLGIEPADNQRLRLHFGRRSRQVTVVTAAGLHPGSARLTRAAAKGLLLAPKTKLTIFRTGSQHLRLGPLIGVLIANARLAALRKGQRDSVYQRLTRYAEELGGQLVFMSTKGIDAARDRAVVYRMAGRRLIRLTMPLPRVIYDRCFGPKSRGQAHWLRRLAQKKRITVINKPVKITKLSTYRTLAADRELRHVVPFAQPLTQQTLTSAIEKYPTLYLKPDSLSRGWGVFRLRRQGPLWVLERQGVKGKRSQRFAYAKVDSLLRRLPRQLKYLVQEGIDLATFYGNRYDFRALTQKGVNGEWQVTGLVARIAPETGVVTGPRSGGLVAPGLQALVHSFGPTRGPALLAELNRTCIKIARRMEQTLGLCAELGIDVGVTRTGEVRLVEVNGRPLKVSLERLNEPGTNERIYRYPIHFAASLDLQPT